MPSNYTPNYQLNQWERADRVLMEDFNADNAKIDGALAGKAEAAALSALQTVVAGKGNCRVAAGSYTGNGTYGVSAQNTLAFPFQPLAVMVVCTEGTAVLIRGAAQCVYHMGYAYAKWNVTWNGNGVSWYVLHSSNANQSSYRVNDETQMNVSGMVYHYIALGAADA